MQNQYTERPYAPHPGYAPPTPGYVNPPYSNQHYGNNHQYPQNQYFYPYYRQAPQYPKIQVTQNTGYYEPVNRQVSPQYPQHQGSTRQAYQRHGVVPAYVQPQTGYRGHRQSAPQTAPVFDNQQQQQQNRYSNVLMEESVAEYDELKHKRNVHIMDIVAPILALCILGAGFLAVYKPFSRSKAAYSISRVEEPPSIADIEASDAAITSSETEVVRDDAFRAERSPVRKTSRRVYQVPRRSSYYGTAAAGADRIIITSTPSGALVKANGNLIGRTPYTWHHPDVYGQVELKAKKKGYGVERTTVEFTGGTVENHFVLKKISPEAQRPAPEQVTQNSTPAQNVPQPAVRSSRTAVRQTVEKSQPALSAASLGSIYLSTIPPNAEVYIHGKKIGTSNTDLTVPAGSHMVKFVKGDKTSARRMTFTAGKNPSQLVRLK